jgi:hypothetical protein
MKVTKRKVVLAILAVGALAALSPDMRLVATVGYDSIRERLHRIPFDGAAWQDMRQINSEDPVRIRMVDDLIRSKRLDGLSRAEVERLLGNIGIKTSLFFGQSHDLAYWLGPERGSIYIEWLAIDFDKDGVVREYRIVRDW